MDVNGNISKISTAKDPFADWPPASKAAMDQLTAIQKALAEITNKNITITVDTVYTSSGSTSTANGVSGSKVLPPDFVTTTPGGTTGVGGTLLPSGAVAGVTDASGNKFFAPSSGTPTIDPSKFGSGIVPYDKALFSKGASAYYDSLAGVDSSTSGTPPINVTVMLDNTAVANSVTSAQVNQSASGIPSAFQRNYAGAW
jgi:hypothetical protein